MQLKNFSEFKINEDWGSSDQTAMNQSMHKDLGSPKKFPGLDPILRAAEDAVDFYWEEWPEYKKDREELINKAGRTYMRAYFPDLFAGFTAMFAESIESDEAFESLLILAEAWRLEPESKDDMRISDIVKKSAGNETKEISLAQQMAKSIKDGDKAIRRARAAFAKGLEHIAKPFYLKAKDLGYDYHLSDAELRMTEAVVDEAMVQVAGKDKPSGAQVLATVIVDYMMEQDYLKPGADKVRKHLIDDLKKLIMDSTF